MNARNYLFPLLMSIGFTTTYPLHCKQPYALTTMEELTASLSGYTTQRLANPLSTHYFDILAAQIPSTLPDAVAKKELKAYCAIIEDACTDTRTLTSARTSIWNSIAPESKIAIHAACTGKGLGHPRTQYWNNNHVDSKLTIATQTLSTEKRAALSAIERPSAACNILGKKGKSLDVGNDSMSIISAIGCAACKTQFTSADKQTCTTLCGAECSTSK
jgi:hypothetical protein